MLIVAGLFLIIAFLALVFLTQVLGNPNIETFYTLIIIAVMLPIFLVIAMLVS